jgi:hypothetical protein
LVFGKRELKVRRLKGEDGIEKEKNSRRFCLPVLTAVGHPVGLVHQHASELFLLVVDAGSAAAWGECGEKARRERKRGKRGKDEERLVAFFFPSALSPL